MTKRTAYTVHNIQGETARFSLLRHAMLFACMISDRMPGYLIEVSAKGGLAGQYKGGQPTPEFKQHHIDGVFH